MSGAAVLVGSLVAWLLPLEATPSPVPVHPPAGSGFAYTTVLGGFFGVGLIVLLWVLLHLKPRPRQPYTGPND